MTSPTSHEQRAAVLALVPLGAIAIGLFVPPALRTGAGVVAMSPWDDGASLFWVYPLVAAGLAVMTALVWWRRGAPAWATAALATAGIAACAWPTIDWLRLEAVEATQGVGLAIAWVACVAIAAVLVVVAWRARGWRRWSFLLAAFAVIAAPFGCPRLPGAWNRFSGGYTFVAADVTLAILMARALRGAARDH